MRAAALLVFAAALAACGGPPDLEAQWNVCRQSTFPAEQVRACSGVIEGAGVDARRRSDALIVRGRQLAGQGQQVRALVDFGRAIRLNPSNAQAYVERALVHEQRRAFGEALVDFLTALRIDPGAEEALRGRDQILADQDNALRQRLEDLDESIARNPREFALWNDRCWTRAIIGEDLEAARADCTESLRLAPHEAEVFDSRGLVELKLGDYAAAEADYNAAIAINPDRGHFLYGRGLARVGLGNTEAGEADLAAARAAQPGVETLYVSYGAPPPPAEKTD